MSLPLLEQLLGQADKPRTSAASPSTQQEGKANLFWNSKYGQQENIPVNYRTLPALTFPQFMTLEPSESVHYLELLRSYGAEAHFRHLTECMGMNRQWTMDELEAHLVNCIEDQRLATALKQLSIV